MNIPEKYIIQDPSLLVAGQKLWSALHGEVEIVEILLFNNNPFPIRVKNSKGVHSQYTKKGKYIEDDLLPTLFLSCPYEVNEFPKVMEVWGEKDIAPARRVVAFKDESGWWAYDNVVTMDEYNSKEDQKPKVFLYNNARDITPVKEVDESNDEMKERTKAIIENIEKELDKLKGSLNK